MKTLSKNDKAEIEQLRKRLVVEIDGLWAGLQASLEQIARKYYYDLGEKFAQLKVTFKGSNQEFGKFCNKHWPTISQRQRFEYMEYWKKLGGKVSSAAVLDDFPPLRRTVTPNYEKGYRKEQYRQIVDEEVKKPQRFEVERQAKDDEGELVVELAEKIISAGFRVLSVKMHPDKDGGSNDAMRRLNKAKKMLEDALTRAAIHVLKYV